MIIINDAKHINSQHMIEYVKQYSIGADEYISDMLEKHKDLKMPEFYMNWKILL